MIAFLSISICSCNNKKTYEAKNVNEHKNDTTENRFRHIHPNQNDTTYVNLMEDEYFVDFVKPLNASAVIAIDFRNEGNYLLELDSKQLKNVRISSYQNPKGITDGPFENKLPLKVDEKGTYFICINENLMASYGPETGDLLLRITKN